MKPLGAADRPFDRWELTFSEAVDETTFDPSDVTLSGPGADLHPLVLTPLGGHRYEADFGGQTAKANYALTVGPDIESVGGQALDQNRDGTPGDGYAAALFASGVTIPEGDRTYDGQSLILYGGTSTIDGSHRFADMQILGGATLTHSAATATEEYRLELAVTDCLLIDATAKIDVSGKGYVEARTLGNTTSGAAYLAGGSYGGLGGSRARYGTNPNWVYGDFRDPNERGSGGASSNSWVTAGSGGGLVRIAAENIWLEGRILAVGGNGNVGHGGSGGGIRIDVGVLRGSGIVSANGGNNSDRKTTDYHDGYYGGGGGGRIAIYYSSVDGFDLARQVTAYGGCADPDPYLGPTRYPGAPGTVYLQSADGNNVLRIGDAGSPAGAYTPLGVPGQNRLEVDELLISGPGVHAAPAHNLTIAAQRVSVLSGATLTHRPATDQAEYALRVEVTDTMIVDANSSLDVSGHGYVHGRTLGNTTQGAAREDAAGSYGGLGHAATSTNHQANAAYGDYRNPHELGSGGGWISGANGGSGGGLIRVTAETLQLDGVLRANGGDGSTGGSGGGIRLDVGTLTGGGSISAAGGNPTAFWEYAAGGGGRIAIYYRDVTHFDLDNSVSAPSGISRPTTNPRIGGGPGTVYLAQSGGPSLLRIDNDGIPAGNASSLGSALGESIQVDQIEICGAGIVAGPGQGTTIRAKTLMVTDGAALEVAAPQPTANGIEAEEVYVLRGAALTHGAASTTAEYALRMVVDRLVLDGTSRIDVSGRGFRGGRTAGNTTTGGATGASGASYGGVGADVFGVSNAVYGDAALPNELGSGGAGYFERGGAGGGLIWIHAATAVLDGSISANGRNGQPYSSWGSGGGSGGGVFIRADVLSGSGLISAAGGDGGSAAGAGGNAGGGGGGRVAVLAERMAGWTQQILVSGGTGTGGNGQPGSVYVARQGGSILMPIRQGEILAGDTLRWAGVGEVPADQGPPSFRWDWDDGRTSVAESPGLVSFGAAGERQVLFQVFNRQGQPLPRPDTRTITVVADPGAVPDLVVTALELPPDLAVGQPAHVRYTVINQGDAAVSGQRWSDRVYLSTDPYLDRWDQRLASASVSADLLAGASYAGSLQVTVPDTSTGAVYLLVSVDDDWEVLERRQLNNELAAAATVAVTMLQDGVPREGQFAESGESRYYRVEVPPGQHLSLTLDAAEPLGRCELYARLGALPTRFAYDDRSIGLATADTRLLVSAPAPGTWYVLAYAASLREPSAYSLLAELTPLTVTSVTPARHTASPDIQLTVSGAGFDYGSAVTLVGADSVRYPAQRVQYRSATQLQATFPANAIPPGFYGVRVDHPSGRSFVLNEAFQVIQAGEPVFASYLTLPASLGYHVPATLYVDYSNHGLSAMRAPILHLTASQKENEQAAALTLDPSLLRQNRFEWDFTGFANNVQFVASGSLPGWLLPGESVRIPVYWAGWTGQIDPSYPPFEFALSRIDEATAAPIDWAAIEPQIRPANVDPQQWADVWPRLAARIGGTWSEYATALRETSERLARRGEIVTDGRRLLEFLIREAAGEATQAILGQVCDADTGGPVRSADVSVRAVDGSSRSAATTDGNGEFVIDGLRPGRYEIVVDGYRIAGSPPEIAVPQAGDVDGVVLLVSPAVPDPVTPESAIASDDDPYLAFGPQGEGLLVWQRGPEIWFATHDGDGWEGSAIPDAFGTDPVVMAVPRQAGMPPDIVVVWQSDQGSGSPLMTAVRRDDGGGPVWSPPRLAGTADVTNAAPAVAPVQGAPLLVWQKRDAVMVDDTDLYYQLLVLESGEGEPWGASCTSGCGLAAAASGGDFSFPLSFERETTLPKWLPLVGGRSGVTIQGELVGSLDDCRLTMAGQIGGELELFDGRATGAASLNASAQWLVRADDANCCAWQFDQAQLGARIGIDAKIPALALDVVVAKLEVGAVVGGGLDGTLTWRGGNFPAWPSEAQVGVDLTLGAYGNVELLFGAFTGDVQGTGTLRGVVDADGFRFDSVTIDLSAEVSAFWFLSKDWRQTWQWPEQARASEAEQSLGGEFGDLYVNPRTGTGTVYGGLAVLDDVAADRYNDGRPVLLPLDGGETLLAWIKDSDRADWLGGVLTVASFDGTGWSEPLEIPGARGFGYTPAATTDADGDPVLIWPWADSSDLTLGDPAQNLLDRMLATDLVYSVRKGGTWSAPAPLVRLDGFERDVSAALAPDGRLVVAWVNQTEAGEQLLASSLDQGQWTAPVQIAAGQHLGNTAVGIVSGRPTILWTAGREIEGRAAEEFLMQAVWDGQWSASARFVLGAAGPSAPAPPTGGAQPASPAAAPTFAAVGPAPAGTIAYGPAARATPGPVRAASEAEPGTTIVVNSTGDENDSDPADGVCDVDSGQPGSQCTLRAAIEESNFRPGQDTIAFAIPGEGMPRIRPQSNLTTVADPVTIDGTTQAEGWVMLDGDYFTAQYGLVLAAGDSTVRGLHIDDFGATDAAAGILVTSNGNTIQGNRCSSQTCIRVLNGHANRIGGTTAAEGNVFWYSDIAVHITGDSVGNIVLGNTFGTKPDGSDGSNSEGIVIDGPGARQNIVGGTEGTSPGGACTGACNLIENSGTSGVRISNGAGGNQVLGNYIGINREGMWVSGPISTTGDDLDPGAGRAIAVIEASGNIVGGIVPEGRNIISSSGKTGILLKGSGSAANVVRGNYIGINTQGTGPLTDGFVGTGITILDASHNTIGGTTPGARNVISANARGVWIAARNGDAVGNVIAGNFIGTNKNGQGQQLGNGSGIRIDGAGAKNNVVGGDTGTTPGGSCTGACNVISDNGRFEGPRGRLGPHDGVHISYYDPTDPFEDEGVFTFPGPSYNIVRGNFIGTDVSGTVPLGNDDDGIAIHGGSHNQIGGDTPQSRNVISSNGANGIEIEGYNDCDSFVPSGNSPVCIVSLAAENSVQGNLIGTDTTGSEDMGNTRDGIEIFISHADPAFPNRVLGNVVSGNDSDGIKLFANGTVILGNHIGVNAEGTAAIPNGKLPEAYREPIGYGLWIGSSRNTVGGAAEEQRNIISGNLRGGIMIQGSENTILGNYVGTDSSGKLAIGNGNDVFPEMGIGIEILGADSKFQSVNNKIGLPGAANVISGNYASGLVIRGNYATGNEVLSNLIGTDRHGEGSSALGNGRFGFVDSYGILIQGAPGNKIGAGNVVENNRHFGIGVVSLATDVTLESIRIRNNRYSGIVGVFEGAVTLILQGSANEIIQNGRHGIELAGGHLRATNLTVTHNAADGIHVAGDVTIQDGKVCYNQGQQIVAGGQQHLTNVNVGCKEEFAEPCCTLFPVPEACCETARDRNPVWKDVQLPQPPLIGLEGLRLRPVGARDPNDKLGPDGYGPARFLRADRMLPYRIDFENDASATAPAQIVMVSDQLDQALDWSTLEFTEFGFGTHFIPLAPGLQEFAWIEPIIQDARELNVHVHGWFDADQGRIEVRFWTTDADTGWPPDALTGFLPPEDGSGRGQGHVSYLIQAVPGLPTGTEIRNVATIQFDFGEVIDTNQVDPHDPSQGTDPAKEALVTIDAGPPASGVEPLAASSGHQFWVICSGHDEGGAGSGIAAYDVFVSDDGGPYALWLANTTDASAVFTGQVGHTYRFFSVAVDNVGHRQAAPGAPDAQTSVARVNWQNPWNRFDVSGDGELNALDALLPINYINAHPGSSSLPPLPALPPHYYDVDGDQGCWPQDVLAVINEINKQLGGGEGNTAGQQAGAEDVTTWQSGTVRVPPTVSAAESSAQGWPRERSVGTQQPGGGSIATSRKRRPDPAHGMLLESSSLLRGVTLGTRHVAASDAAWADPDSRLPELPGLDAILPEIAPEIHAVWQRAAASGRP